MADFKKVATRIWPEGCPAPRSRAKARPRAAAGTMVVDAEARRRWAEGTKHDAFNRWLNRQVRDSAGDLDLGRLYEIALSFGVDERYDHLNPGQQRMNVGNRLRRVVPKATYGDDSPEPPPRVEA